MNRVDPRGPFAVPRRATRWPPALVRPRPTSRTQAIVSCGGRTFIVAMGRSGIAAVKREGDGATPRGRLTPRTLLRRKPCPSPLPWRLIRPGDGWCDDTGSQHYNRAVPHPSPMSHEAILRDDALYDHVIVTDHNATPRVRGAGSAIFFHVARPALTPTEGCLAFPAAVWRRGIVPMGPYLIGIPPRPMRAR
ncbi:hypothetical protein RDV64_08270 [Acuticoccus sp. MNP-M23]|uniref:L,D-transpeptidase family protein n=1 Tax=Acuticoccus sp. MNP-M23 TaxID=3072793 RepID=UPI002815A082|nr:L,D-transpeptidase family protein [Acuticoccus sp. MNP-M23]WMS44372.1 hypothetical protein RDV64_08270 [Acuticoccus sp. MNP-M23]